MNIASILSAEAKKRGISKIESQTGLSRSHIYGILNGKTDPSLHTLQKLLAPMGFQLVLKRIPPNTPQEPPSSDLDYIIWSMSKNGAPIMATKQFETQLDLNETIIHALENGRIKSSINAVLPFFIYSNWKNLNWKKVEKSISDKRYLAYQLNLIFHFTNNLDISSKLQILRNEIGELRYTQRLIQRGKISEFEKKKLNTVSNMIATSWKFKTADSLEDIQARFQKWASVSK